MHTQQVTSKRTVTWASDQGQRDILDLNCVCTGSARLHDPVAYHGLSAIGRGVHIECVCTQREGWRGASCLLFDLGADGLGFNGPGL